MKAYNSNTIFNASIKQKAENWFVQKLISREQYESISNHYPNNFYTPNIFVKVGLFIFTCFIILAALGMYFLVFGSVIGSSETGFFIFTALFFAVACFVTLELLIRSKQLYNSGTDEALLYAGLLSACMCLFAITDIYTKVDSLLLPCLALPFFAVATLRYSDRLVTLVLCICVYSILFLSILKFGDVAKMIMPFALMCFSAVLYFISKKLTRKSQLSYWHSCIVVVEFVALVIFYVACNYFVIRESSVEFFDLELAAGQDIPLAFLFYILTATVPLGYIYFGLKQKDKTLLWTGLILLAASAITFKYYFSLGHPEIALTVAGILLILIAYFSIKYFKTSRHGITFEEEKDANSFLKSNAEALIILEGMAQKTTNTSEQGFEFGEGKSGGAGSGGSF